MLKALRMARADAGLTISELAKRAGVSRDTISDAERGHHSLQAATLNKLARALNKTPSALLAEEERLAPKAESSLSPEPSLDDVLDDERRTAWEAAVVEGQRLRETGRGRMRKALSEWSASKQRGEPDATRREYLDEMEDLLQEAYGAYTAVEDALSKAIEAAFTQGGRKAIVPSYLRYLQQETRAANNCYVELFVLVSSVGLRVSTEDDVAAASRAAKAQPEARSHSIQDLAA